MPAAPDLCAGIVALRALLHKARTLRRKAPTADSRVALELFAGSGRLSQALIKQGVPSISIDVCSDSRLDLTSTPLINFIQHLICCGHISFVWLGTPSNSWFLARRGLAGGYAAGGPLRTNQFLYGHPEALAREDDKYKIALGNATMRASAGIISTCIRHDVPCALENPCGSRLFRVRPIASLVRHISADSHVCDFCQFGAPYRKRTRIVFWKTGRCATLDRRCTGAYSECSATGKPHVLTTAIAEPYPIRLARESARFISNILGFARPPVFDLFSDSRS